MKPPLMLRERLAAHAHKMWSGWMEYEFSKGVLEGMVVQGMAVVWHMPSWAYDRWQRQMRTPYDELSQEEKESDRIEADGIYQVIIDHAEGEGLIILSAADLETKLAAVRAETLSEERGDLLSVITYARSAALKEGGNTGVVQAANRLLKTLEKSQ